MSDRSWDLLMTVCQVVGGFLATLAAIWIALWQDRRTRKLSRRDEAIPVLRQRLVDIERVQKTAIAKLQGNLQFAGADGPIGDLWLSFAKDGFDQLENLSRELDRDLDYWGHWFDRKGLERIRSVVASIRSTARMKGMILGGPVGELPTRGANAAKDIEAATWIADIEAELKRMSRS